MGILTPKGSVISLADWDLESDHSDDENVEYIVEVDEREMNSMNTIP